MFCKNCGKEIDDKAIICVYCGVPTDGNEKKQTSSETNVPAIAGFILSFFIAIAGLVCSIIGYKRAPELGGKGKGLALAGIIISAISMVIVCIYVIIVVVATMGSLL